MKKPRIFLVNVGERDQHDQYTPPVGLLYIAGWLRARMPVELCVVSQRTENLSSCALVDRIRSFAPDIVGMSCMTPHANVLPDLVRGVRSVCPDALIVLGGPHVRALKAQALEDTQVDLGVVGEGELAMEMIVEAWRSGGGYDAIPGILRRTESGEITTNPGTIPMIDDMDSLPFPAYDLIDPQRYWTLKSQTLFPYSRKYIAMYTSRGCPYCCDFCSNIFGARYRPHSAERIVAEMGHYMRKYGIEEVGIYDDCFNLRKDRVLSFSEQQLRQNGRIGLFFPTGVRADILDEQTLDALVETGMYFASFALETGSPRLQKFINKNLNIENYLKAVAYAVRCGVFANGFVMLGFPTETAAEMQQTITTATESRLHTAEFFAVTPLPNTAITAWAMEHMPERLKGVSLTHAEYWRISANLSAESDATLRRYHRKAYRSFYSSPSRVARILRDYPKPLYLAANIPEMLRRIAKGIL